MTRGNLVTCMVNLCAQKFEKLMDAEVDGFGPDTFVRSYESEGKLVFTTPEWPEITIDFAKLEVIQRGDDDMVSGWELDDQHTKKDFAQEEINISTVELRFTPAKDPDVTEIYIKDHFENYNQMKVFLKALFVDMSLEFDEVFKVIDMFKIS